MNSEFNKDLQWVELLFIRLFKVNILYIVDCSMLFVGMFGCGSV